MFRVWGSGPQFLGLMWVQRPAQNSKRGPESSPCSSFLGLPFRIFNVELVKPKKGTTMETIGRTPAAYAADCKVLGASFLA